jgi:flagellar basal body-associated protein FliL
MMGDDATYEEIEARISAVRDNIRDLIEQASAASGEPPSSGSPTG